MKSDHPAALAFQPEAESPQEAPTKTCGLCGDPKPITEFFRNRANKDGLGTRCKKCHHEAGPRTIRVSKASKVEFATAQAANQTAKRLLPMTRGECEMGPRPCPYVSCRFHLYLSVNERNGSIQLSFPGKEPDELVVSCALDVAAAEGLRLEGVANAMGVTRERIRQIEFQAIRKIRNSGLLDLVESEVEW